jgi:hypothetical protein
LLESALLSLDVVLMDSLVILLRVDLSIEAVPEDFEEVALASVCAAGGDLDFVGDFMLCVMKFLEMARLARKAGFGPISGRGI